MRRCCRWRTTFSLVNCAERRFDVQHEDKPFDLSPAAIMQVIADTAAGLGSVGRLETCCFSEPVDQRFGLNDIAWFDIKRQVHGRVGFPVISGWQTGPGGWPVCSTVFTFRMYRNGQSYWLAKINPAHRAC